MTYNTYCISCVFFSCPLLFLSFPLPVHSCPVRSLSCFLSITLPFHSFPVLSCSCFLLFLSPPHPSTYFTLFLFLSTPYPLYFLFISSCPLFHFPTSCPPVPFPIRSNSVPSCTWFLHFLFATSPVRSSSCLFLCTSYLSFPVFLSCLSILFKLSLDPPLSLYPPPPSISPPCLKPNS